MQNSKLDSKTMHNLEKQNSKSHKSTENPQICLGSEFWQKHVVHKNSGCFSSQSGARCKAMNSNFARKLINLISFKKM